MNRRPTQTSKFSVEVNGDVSTCAKEEVVDLVNFCLYEFELVNSFLQLVLHDFGRTYSQLEVLRGRRAIVQFALEEKLSAQVSLAYINFCSELDHVPEKHFLICVANEEDLGDERS